MWGRLRGVAWCLVVCLGARGFLRACRGRGLGVAAGPQGKREMGSAGALWRPGMRAGGEGSFLTNPGVLVRVARTSERRSRPTSLCADASPFRPLRLGTEAQQLRLGQSALTRGPAAPAAELSPAATKCAAGWHSDAVLLPCAMRSDKGRTS